MTRADCEAPAAETPVGGAGGTAVHVCVFDEHAQLKEIRIQPLEPLGGTVFTADEGTNVPRFRRQLPLMPEEGNPVAKRVLQHSIEVSQPFGTELELRDGQAIVHVQ